MADNMTHCVRCGDPFEMSAGADTGDAPVCKKCQLKEREKAARAKHGPDAVDADVFEQEELKAELKDAQKVAKADDMPDEEKEAARRIVETPHGQSVLKGVVTPTPAPANPDLIAPAPDAPASPAPAPAAPVRAADMPSAPAPSTASETPIRPRQPGAVPRPNVSTPPRVPEKESEK